MRSQRNQRLARRAACRTLGERMAALTLGIHGARSAIRPADAASRSDRQGGTPLLIRGRRVVNADGAREVTELRLPFALRFALCATSANQPAAGLW
jgi:hypothetical protein